MDRVIKFRVWDTEKNEWLKTGGALIGQVDKEFVLNGHFSKEMKVVFQQFTGAVDKDGREIYEGDIVAVVDLDNQFVVEFGKVVRDVKSYDGQTTYPLEFNTFFFEALDDHKAYFSITENSYGCHDLKMTEIIGNIFENPRMLC